MKESGFHSHSFWVTLSKLFDLAVLCFLSCQMQLILSKVMNFVRLKMLILVLVLRYCKKIQKLDQAVAMSSYIAGFKWHGHNLF